MAPRWSYLLCFTYSAIIGKFKKCDGYQPKRVTPYMHALCHHVGDFIATYGSIKPFSCQGKSTYY